MRFLFLRGTLQPGQCAPGYYAGYSAGYPDRRAFGMAPGFGPERPDFPSAFPRRRRAQDSRRPGDPVADGKSDLVGAGFQPAPGQGAITWPLTLPPERERRPALASGTARPIFVTALAISVSHQQGGWNNDPVGPGCRRPRDGLGGVPARPYGQYRRHQAVPQPPVGHRRPGIPPGALPQRLGGPMAARGGGLRAAFGHPLAHSLPGTAG